MHVHWVILDNFQRVFHNERSTELCMYLYSIMNLDKIPPAFTPFTLEDIWLESGIGTVSLILCLSNKFWHFAQILHIEGYVREFVRFAQNLSVFSESLIFFWKRNKNHSCGKISFRNNNIQSFQFQELGGTAILPLLPLRWYSLRYFLTSLKRPGTKWVKMLKDYQKL